MAEEAGVALEQVTKRFGEVTAVSNISLEIRDGEFFSLLGPSGCGKTTTLRMIAGFEQPTEGQINIKGQPVAGIPAHKRPVNTVFQSYALFPHMSVADNIAFGLQMSKTPKAEIKDRVQEALALVQLPQMAERRPRQLSGGQQQRIALARALVNRPRVLLLDEPLGALDLKLRKAMQFELKRIQSEVGITFVYVTHDQEEALTMSDRIGVMDQGIVRQVGTPRDIYEHPNSRYVADFIGETNFIEGAVKELGELATVQVGETAVSGSAEGQTLTAGQDVTLAIRPEKIKLYSREVADLPRESNSVMINGRIAEATYIGTDTRYRVLLPDDNDVVVRVQNFGNRYDTTFTVGDDVYVHWAAENAQILVE